VTASADKLTLALEMIETAETSLKTAKQLLMEATGQKPSRSRKKPVDTGAMEDLNAPLMEGTEKVIEGIFDGERMMGSDKNEYAVPANYASKSKLVAGDVLKLRILPDGSFMYKQINQIPRKHLMGTLTYDNAKYKVLAGGMLYSVLLASVTYYKGEVGDKVSLIVPAAGETEWGAVDFIIPHSEAQLIENAEDE